MWTHGIHRALPIPVTRSLLIAAVLSMSVGSGVGCAAPEEGYEPDRSSQADQPAFGSYCTEQTECTQAPQPTENSCVFYVGFDGSGLYSPNENSAVGKLYKMVPGPAAQGANGKRAAVVEALLRKTNLWDHRKKRVGGYSGGMKRRFGIAVALLGDPRLIIVDEPTAGLDPAERARFHNLLSELGRDAIVLLSTHIVEDVANLCPTVAVLYCGRIQLQGSPDELCARLAPRLFARAVDGTEVAAIEAQLPVISTRLRAGRHEVRVLADEAPEGFAPAVPTLEDVYFAVTTERWS